MRITVIGAGELGAHIASRMVKEGHDVILLARDSQRVLELSRQLDLMTLVGSVSEPENFRRAQVAECDVLIATTDYDEINILACILAKKLSRRSQEGFPKTIARVRGLLFDTQEGLGIKQEDLAIDVFINPEEILTQQLLELVQSPSAFEIISFPESDLLIKGFHITTEDPDLVGIPIRDLVRKYESHFSPILILAILRKESENSKETLIIPQGEESILSEDKVYVLSQRTNFPRVSQYFHEDYREVKHIFLSGDSKVLRVLCQKLLILGFRVSILEEDRAHCLTLSEMFPKVEVLHSDPNDSASLEAEGLEKADLFISLSENEEKNLFSSMLAKKQGIPRTIARIQNEEYRSIAHFMGIDAVVNIQSSTAGEILRWVRGGTVQSVDTLVEADSLAKKEVEIISYEVVETSSVKDKPIHAIQLPKESLFAAIVRNGNTLIPKGEDRFNLGDRVFVFSTLTMASKVAKLF